MNTLAQLQQNAQAQFDLTESTDQSSLYALAENLLALPELDMGELKEVALEPTTPLEFKIAAKLVDSRQYMQTITQPVHLAVIFAMWGVPTPPE